MHHEAWYHDPTYWVALGFVLFLGVFARFVLPRVIAGLDARSNAIREQLEQASRLRAEAEEVLASFKVKQAEMEIEAARILEEARADAELLRSKAKDELAQMIDRRHQQADAKIAMLEKKAEAEIRAKLVEIATQAAATLMRDKLATESVDPVTTRAISEIEQKLH